MRKILLTSAGMLALSMGGAMAQELSANRYPHSGGNHYRPTIENYYAAALGVNVGGTAYNESFTHSQSSSAAISGSFQGSRGVMQQNQNAGANSSQQNAVAVAYIEGCRDCYTGQGAKEGEADANSVAANLGVVWGNSSGNVNGSGGSSRYASHGGNSSATARMEGSYTGGTVGVAQVNQNAGPNSLQQNAAALVAVENLTGRREQERDAWALSGNAGLVAGSGNFSDDARIDRSGSISSSFDSFTGAASVNQNVAANSLQQNSTALSAITFCDCAEADLSTTIAAAVNLGAVIGNAASSAHGSNGVSMSSSFNNATGTLQVSQNAGANSMAQNAISVGAIFQH